MKKILILFIVALIAVGVYSKYHNLNARPITLTEEKQLKEDDHEKKRLEELKKLQNPEFVESKLHSVGKLTTLEGQLKYSSTITDKFLNIPIRGMTLDLDYSFGLGMSLEYVKVVNIYDRIIILQIPKNRLQLQYIQMDSDSKIIDGYKMILVSQFRPSDVEELVKDSQQKVVNKIGSESKYFNIAEDNLKCELTKLCQSLGYQKVMFRD